MDRCVCVREHVPSPVSDPCGWWVRVFMCAMHVLVGVCNVNCVLCPVILYFHSKHLFSRLHRDSGRSW